MLSHIPQEAVIVVLDVSKSMKQGEPSRISSALKAVSMLVQQKLLYKPKDEIGLVLFGTDETDNALHDELGGYENVSVSRDLDVTTLGFLTSLDGIQTTDSEGDLLNALMVGLDLLHKRTAKKKYSKRLFLVSDGGSSISGVDDVGPILDSLEAMECKMTVMYSC
jgi:ATP-dependent DNA helicase 2 subunit 2